MAKLLPVLLLAFSLPVFPSDSPLLKSAQDAFASARRVCAQDAGKLWGVELCGPMILFDPATRQVFGNQADRENMLHAEQDVWTGRLPDAVNAANTAIAWAGVKWTMLILPLPSEAEARSRLLAHEMFHRVQDDLGFGMGNPANAHLETAQGRLWLRLELRALSEAMQSSGEARHKAVADALSFRAERWRLFPDSAREESVLERNEGIAEYTGVCLDGFPLESKVATVVEQLRATRPSYVRSFAYATGPAYGLLLDDADKNWKKKLGTGQGLSTLLESALGLGPQAVTEERVRQYGGDALKAEESERAKEIAARQAKYRALLVDGPTLTLPHGKAMSIGFNPNNLLPLGRSGHRLSDAAPVGRVGHPERCRWREDYGGLETNRGRRAHRHAGSPHYWSGLDTTTD